MKIFFYILFTFICFSAKSDGISELQSQKISLLDFALFKIDTYLNKTVKFQNYEVNCNSHYDENEIIIGCKAEIPYSKKIKFPPENKIEYDIDKKLVQDYIAQLVLRHLGNYGVSFYPSELVKRISPNKLYNPDKSYHRKRELLGKKIKKLIFVRSRVTHQKRQGAIIKKDFETCQTTYPVDIKYKRQGLIFNEERLKRTCSQF